jgi:hypothetical protein
VEDGREVSKEAVGGRRQRQEGNNKREREKGAIRAAGPGEVELWEWSSKMGEENGRGLSQQ